MSNRPSFRNLHEFVDFLEQKGELVRIKTPVSCELEITEIADRVMKSEGGGKALLFECVTTQDNSVSLADGRKTSEGKQSTEEKENLENKKSQEKKNIPLLINAFGSRQRMSWALGVEDLEEIAARITSLINTPQILSDNPGFLNKLQQIPQLIKLADSFPKTVSRGACQEVVLKGDEIDLTKLPVLKCWPEDGGAFITLPCVFTRDPKTGARNVGMYRMQVFDKNTTGMHWQKHKTGARHYEDYQAMLAAANSSQPTPFPLPQREGNNSGAAPLHPQACTPDGKQAAGPFDPATSQPLSSSIQVEDPERANREVSSRRASTNPEGLQENLKNNPYLIPVSVSLGGDPAITYAATAPLPEDIDEMVFAGWLRGKPVEMVKCLTNDLQVPADAEIILEGYVDPAEPLRREGPFGDHTGYYSLADNYPVFHVTALTHRRNPLYPATIVGRPPMEDAWLGKASERIFLPLIKLQLPEIVDLNMPIEGVFHNMVIVSIKKRYPGQARKVACALWGLGQMMFAKMILVVDSDVNVQDYRELLWRVGNNISPARDVFFMDGPIDSLDHASPLPNYGSKMGIDATKKLPSEGFTREWPEVMQMSAEVKRRVDEMWKNLGL